MKYMPEVPLLPQEIDRYARETPHENAVKFLRMGLAPLTLTFLELQEQIDSVAALLKHQLPVTATVEFGQRVLLLYPQGLEFVAAFLGCLKAGVIAVPAYPPRPNRASPRLAGIVADCNPALVLTTTEVLPSITRDLCGGAQVLATDRLPSVAAAEEFGPVRPDMAAYLQYTSGSTSAPKGTIITHGAVVHNILHLTSAFGLRENWNVVSWLPMHHDMGLVGTLLSPLYLGGRTTLLPPNLFLQNPFLWLMAFTTERGNFSASPNFGFEHCCKMISDDQLSQLDLTSVQLIVNGSEPLRTETIDRFVKRFGPCGFSAEKMFPSYGLAEATLFVTGGPYGKPARRVRVDAVTSEPTTEMEQASKTAVSCGAPPPNVRVIVVHSETQTACSDGKIGEIWVQSPSNGLGYWGNAEQSRQTFQNYLANGDGPFLNTGDLGYLLDGELFVTGRSKDLIIIRGRNLYPQDIECTVENVLPFLISEFMRCGFNGRRS